MALSRRSALIGATAAFLSGPARAARRWSGAQQRLADIETAAGGRLGVAALDSATGETLKHRGDERFAMCSTFKLLAAACVLSRVDAGKDSLDRRVRFSKSDLVTYSPVTERHADTDRMTLADLCEAAITLSDNTAANLLLASFGGPAALTAFARSLGDEITRLDRIETALNEATPGDPRDTTTPSAMLASMRTLLLETRLSEGSRRQLIEWLVANKTGDKRLRAGIPASWRVGDKTGSGGHAATNDVAIMWPDGGAPILVAVYFAESKLDADARNAVIAEVGRVIAGG
jgi:beta-lactamase class A